MDTFPNWDLGNKKYVKQLFTKSKIIWLVIYISSTWFAMARAAFSHREPFPRVSLLPLTCTVPGHRALQWEEFYIFSIQLKFLTWKDWPWLPPSAISREGEELIRPSGGTPCRSPQTRDPLKMCFILNHSINYGVTFSSGFPSLEMKLFTYCKTSSWCFGKSLDKNQLYTKSEQILTQYLKKWISPVIRNLLTTLRRK